MLMAMEKLPLRATVVGPRLGHRHLLHQQAACCGSRVPSASRCVRILMRVNGIGLYSRSSVSLSGCPWFWWRLERSWGAPVPLDDTGVLTRPPCSVLEGSGAGRHVPDGRAIAGALVFTIDDWDEKVSAWATKNTPLFGSESQRRMPVTF